MYAISRKILLALVVATVVLTTGAWQVTPVIPAGQPGVDSLEAPLFPGLTWSDPVASSQNIRTDITGDSISLPGKRYEAQERFLADVPLPQDLVDYYSNRQLGLAGWVSYDAFDTANGVHYVFYQEPGIYLSVEFLECRDDPSKICVAVWMSDQGNGNAVSASASAIASEQELQAASSTFGKISPANGSTNLNPTSVTLSWNAYSPQPDKYSYCIQEGSACENNDPDWTSTLSTSVTLNNLGNNKTYYWQVKAITCVECTPKTVVYADGGTAWHFKTSTSSVVTILGNAGVASAVLSYVVSGSNKTVTANSTGAYSLTVPYNWSGTLTPSKAGYLFVPASASFTNVTASQTIQNFLAAVAITISGNAGRPGVTLSYTDGTPKTVVSDSNGNYSIVLPAGWSGTITPSLATYSFSPPSRSYTNLAANQTAQNYTATLITYKISGKTDAGSVTLTYTNGTPQSVVSDGGGNYSITIPTGWSGTITPSNPCLTFNLPSLSYSNVTSNQTLQNYTATLKAGCSRVNVSIAKNPAGWMAVPSSGSAASVYPGTLNGPVLVSSGTSQNILTSQRSITSGGINEVMGYPASQITKEYWFTWYDWKSAGVATWILVGNPSTSQDAHVNIYVAGVHKGNYTIKPGENITPYYQGLMGGPVQVLSDIDVYASERTAVYNSFHEVTGYPADQFDTEYWFPWYDWKSAGAATWVVMANPDPSRTATVDVYLAGVYKQTFTILPGQSDVYTNQGFMGGPVKVMSKSVGGSPAVPILASERTVIGNTFNELMGYPASQFTTTYYYPWYDNQSIVTWILIGNPSDNDADTVEVDVYIGGQFQQHFVVPAKQSISPTFNSLNGPLEVRSTNGKVFFTSERILYQPNVLNAFNETFGIPANKLDTDYYFTWYDQVTMNTDTIVAKP